VKGEDDCHLVDSLEEDHLPHRDRDDGGVSRIGFAVMSLAILALTARCSVEQRIEAKADLPKEEVF
jgi:hypothetical protein